MTPITKEWLDGIAKGACHPTLRVLTYGEADFLIAIARAALERRDHASPPRDHYDTRLIEILNQILSGIGPKGESK